MNFKFKSVLLFFKLCIKLISLRPFGNIYISDLPTFENSFASDCGDLGWSQGSRARGLCNYSTSNAVCLCGSMVEGGGATCRIEFCNCKVCNCKACNFLCIYITWEVVYRSLEPHFTIIMGMFLHITKKQITF